MSLKLVNWADQCVSVQTPHSQAPLVNSAVGLHVAGPLHKRSCISPAARAPQAAVTRASGACAARAPAGSPRPRARCPARSSLAPGPPARLHTQMTPCQSRSPAVHWRPLEQRGKRAAVTSHGGLQRRKQARRRPGTLGRRKCASAGCVENSRALHQPPISNLIPPMMASCTCLELLANVLALLENVLPT